MAEITSLHFSQNMFSVYISFKVHIVTFKTIYGSEPRILES